MTMNARFTGTLGGGGQNVFSSTAIQKDDPFGGSTPAPKPSNARRLGTSFMGGIAPAQPRAAGTDPSFNSVNLTNAPRQEFGRMGERAGNEAVQNYNTEAVSWNEQQAADKAAEIAAHTATVNRLNKTYNSGVNAYNAEIGRWNATKAEVDNVNSLADQYNAAASIYRSTGSSSSTPYANSYNQARLRLDQNPHLEGHRGDDYFDEDQMALQYGQYITVPRSDLGWGNPIFPSTFNGRTQWNQMTSVRRLDAAYNQYRAAGGRDTPPNRHIGQAWNPNYLVGALGQGAYNPWQDEIYNNVNVPWKNTTNVPYVYGGYQSGVDQYGWYDPQVTMPTRPSLPAAPDPVFEQRQMREALPDRPERQLAPGQREIVGGDLPPQVAKETGDTFGVAARSNASIDYRELEQINASERQTLGAPVAYRTPTWSHSFLGGQVTNSGGGKTFGLNDITNSTDTHLYFRNYGWVPRDQLTPLY